MMPFRALRMRSTSSAGTSLIRAQGIQAWDNSSSASVAIPGGAVAGDTIVLFSGSSWVASLVSGFTQQDNNSGSNWNGFIQTKVLTSGDISTGSFTVTFAGTHAGCIWAVVLVGSVSVRTVISNRNASGGSGVVRTVTTDGTPTSGDTALYFGSCRTSGDTITTDRGTASTAQTNAVTNGGGRGFKETLPSSGAISVNFTYTGTVSNGDYQAIFVVH